MEVCDDPRAISSCEPNTPHSSKGTSEAPEVWIFLIKEGKETCNFITFNYLNITKKVHGKKICPLTKTSCI